jgi:DNA-3-methyladenine glycosylase II
MKDDELRAKLVAIRGLGDWSVDMYLLFSAHRSDVFPVGDLAVCKGLQAHLGVTGIS